jgi:hypothetical protein
MPDAVSPSVEQTAISKSGLNETIDVDLLSKRRHSRRAAVSFISCAIERNKPAINSIGAAHLIRKQVHERRLK